MVRLSDYAEQERQHLLALPCPVFGHTPFVTGVHPATARVAIVSTAGLHLRSDVPFGVGDSGYRIIPTGANLNEVVMSHISTNFDRTGFQLDINMVLPLDRLAELAAARDIASVAAYHYSFMGATDPTQMLNSARDVATLLNRDQVNAAILVPV